MIRITTQQGQIGINTTNARLLITQRPAEIDTHTEQATLEMHTEQIQIRIDQQQCFNESGLMSPSAFSEDVSQQGKQAVYEGISRRAAEGNQMAAIEKGNDAIANIAFDNSFHIADFNITFMPKSKPEIDFVGGNIDIKVNEGSVEMKVKINRPDIEFEPGSIEIFLKQKPDISIKYIGENVDVEV